MGCGMNKQTEQALKMAIEHIEMQQYGHAIDVLYKALEQPACNPHPKAPHGFNRDASHSADRYVCDCEGWDAWQDGYDEGLRKGLALEQPAQEPVAWMNDIAYSDEIDNLPANRGEIIPLYSRPYQWQGLTDDEMKKVIHAVEDKFRMQATCAIAIVRATEQALKEKNHA